MHTLLFTYYNSAVLSSVDNTEYGVDAFAIFRSVHGLPPSISVLSSEDSILRDSFNPFPCVIIPKYDLRPVAFKR